MEAMPAAVDSFDFRAVAVWVVEPEPGAMLMPVTRSVDAADISDAGLVFPCILPTSSGVISVD